MYKLNNKSQCDKNVLYNNLWGIEYIYEFLLLCYLVIMRFPTMGESSFLSLLN